MVFGERQIRKNVVAPVPGSDAAFITSEKAKNSVPEEPPKKSVPQEPARKAVPVGKPLTAGQLTFDAFGTQAAPKPQVPQFTVQRELSGKTIPLSDQEFVHKHTADLRAMQKYYADRINKYQVTPHDPDLKQHNVFLALEKHHLDNRTSQAKYAALIRRAKEHFAQGTHKQLVEELLKEGVLKQTIW